MAEKKLYDFEVEEKKSDKLKKQREKQLAREKRKNKKKTSKIMLENNRPSSQPDLDNEIIIGVTVNTPNANTKRGKNKKRTQKNNRKKVPESIILENKKQKNKVETGNSKVKSKIIKWTGFFIVLIGVITFAFVSPLFNINKISVTGNNVLTNEKVIGMSQIEIGQNIFKINKVKIKQKIKENGYIENVSIKRRLPDEIELIVQERVPSFQIEYGGGFVLINNQGYIIETVSKKHTVPMLKGATTSDNSYISNNRLNDEDLNKLNVVLKIINAASSNDIYNSISSIDMTSPNNFIVNFDSEHKIAYFGDCSNIETRMLWAKRMMETTTGKSGEMHIEMNLNTRTPYFRESIQQ